MKKSGETELSKSLDVDNETDNDVTFVLQWSAQFFLKRLS